MSVAERKNAAVFIANTTVRPFIFIRYFFECFFCHDHFHDMRTILQHTVAHEIPETDKIFNDLLPEGGQIIKVDISELKCRICDEGFEDLDKIRAHLAETHNKEFTKSRNGMIPFNCAQKDDQFSCHICSDMFKTFKLLNRHMSVHFSKAICETCGVGFMSYQRMVKHKESHFPTSYPCDQCEKVYGTSHRLREHVEKAHKSLEPDEPKEGTSKKDILRCPHCHETFFENYLKLKHLKVVHDISFTFECETCKARFSTRRALTMHTNKLHSQKTTCQVCKKSFSTAANLKTHMVTHSIGLRNFICDLCQKAFSDQQSLKEHMQTHLQQEWYKFPCSECGTGFVDKNTYDHHMNEMHPKSLFHCDLELE